MVAIIDSKKVKLCVILLLRMKNFARDYLSKEMKAEHILVTQKDINSSAKNKSFMD